MGKTLPKNWVETNLESFCTLVKEKGETGVKPYLEIGAIDIEYKKYFLNSSKASVKGNKIARKYDVLVSRVRPTRGAIVLVKEDFLNVSSAFTILRLNNFKSSKFLFYILAYNKLFSNYLGNNCTGTMYPTISEKLLLKYCFSLPPLKEQQRIVAKLDTLFTHLDSLKTRLANIPTLLKNFRQAILTQAVTGKLTQEWRKGKELEEWKEDELGNIGIWKGGGTPSKAVEKYWINGDVLWITPKDMKSLMIVDTIDKITKESVENSSANYIEANSILMVTRSGILRRILPISMNSKVATVNQDIKALTLNDEFNPKFILYILRGLEENIRTTCMKSGTTVESVEFFALKKYLVKFPNKKEQTEIVKRVEYLFAKADKIEAQYTKLKEKIDSLPQAILAKAFKGELVPQLSTDGDAKDLLAEIQKLKASLRGTKQSVKRRRKVKN